MIGWLSFFLTLFVGPFSFLGLLAFRKDAKDQEDIERQNDFKIGCIIGMIFWGIFWTCYIFW